MNEHDGLEPTAAIQRIDVPPAGDAPAYLPPQPIPPQPSRPPQSVPVTPTAGTATRPVYRFGNPFTYVLRRLLAFTLDFVVVTSVATMLLYGLIAINPLTGLPSNSEGGFDATLGMGVAIALVYLWLFEAIFGTTLGKLAFSLHVYAPKARFVGIGRAFVRNLLRPIDLLAIGPILALLPGHRRLGDLFGGTVVAHSPLRGFSPLLGWLLLVGLGAVPFLVAGGTVTVLAVGTAFIEFVPPLGARGVHGLLVLLTTLSGLAAPHAPASAGPAAAASTGVPAAAPGTVAPAPGTVAPAPGTVAPTPVSSPG